jgi:hypothetical protein
LKTYEPKDGINNIHEGHKPTAPTLAQQLEKNDLHSDLECVVDGKAAAAQINIKSLQHTVCL